MFNGIIYNLGQIKYIKKNNTNFLIGIKTNLIFKKKEIGSSICCNGACLTITNIKNKLIYFYVSNETLNKSNFKFIKINNLINIEKSLVYGQKISGHIIQGHVDTTASITKIIIQDKTWLIKFSLNNKKLSNMLVEKASISINGVSLTISKIKNYLFQINVIPHTLSLTNLKNLRKKDTVNVEIDFFAKYILKISN